MSAGRLDGYANTKSLWFASDTPFGQDKTLAGIRSLSLGRPDGLKGKPTLTYVKLPKSSLSQNLSFLEQYFADLALYNSFYTRINILQYSLNYVVPKKLVS
jgi:hypothetical protein